MFEEAVNNTPKRNYLAKQVLLDIYGAKFDELNELNNMSTILRDAIERSGMKLLHISYYRIEPHGLSLVCMLSDNYISVRTYPERGYTTIDISTGHGDSVFAANLILQAISHKHSDIKIFNCGDENVINKYNSKYNIEMGVTTPTKRR